MLGTQTSDPSRCGSERQVPSIVRSFKLTVQESSAARPLHASTASGGGPPGGGPLAKQASGRSPRGSERQVPSIVWPLKVTLQESPAARLSQAATMSGGGSRGAGSSPSPFARLATSEPAMKTKPYNPFQQVIGVSSNCCLARPKARWSATRRRFRQQARCHCITASK